jgi:putative NIF3 family GTP cyclohydrolase 1 type 2
MPVSYIRQNDILGGKIIKAIKNNISVISIHLNCDMANGGIDETLANLFMPFNIEILQDMGNKTGYGRIFDIETKSLQQLAQTIKKEINSDKILVYGEKEKTVKRIAVFCGGGFEAEFFDKFKADLIVSSDMKHHLIAEAIERGFSVLNISHYGAENYSFKKICSRAKDVLKINSIYFEDKILL